MTVTRVCPTCGTTYWATALHYCPRREPAPPPPGSSLATTIALAVFVLVFGLAVGWALNSWLEVF